jgi:hypothetical protein
LYLLEDAGSGGKEMTGVDEVADMTEVENMTEAEGMIGTEDMKNDVSKEDKNG